MSTQVEGGSGPAHALACLCSAVCGGRAVVIRFEPGASSSLAPCGALVMLVLWIPKAPCHERRIWLANQGKGPCRHTASMSNGAVHVCYRWSTHTHNWSTTCAGGMSCCCCDPERTPNQPYPPTMWPDHLFGLCARHVLSDGAMYTAA